MYLRSSGTAVPPHIVIVGAGFGGLTCAMALRRARARLTLIDERNFHLFQPLLYQVATAALSPTDIAMPIRRILHRQRNARVVLGKVEAIDRAVHRVCLSGGQDFSYDYLLIATGARHAYFGHEDWEAFAPGLKHLEDATAVRGRLLKAFENAEVESNPDERLGLLSFIVIGARVVRVVALGRRTHLLPHRLSQSHHGRAELAVGLLHPRAGCRPDYSRTRYPGDA